MYTAVSNEWVWTKILNEPALYGSYTQHNTSIRAYHNWDHLRAMFNFLEKNRVPYSPELDWAIHFHDWIYDDQPEKETRSAEEFTRIITENKSMFAVGVPDEVRALIFDTIDHIPREENILSHWMVAADLSSFLTRWSAYEGHIHVAEEMTKLYNVTPIEFLEANNKYLQGLAERLSIVFMRDQLTLEFDNIFATIISVLNKILIEQQAILDSKL